jgi:hypothetical protein
MGTGGSRYGAGRPGWRRKCEHYLRFDVRNLHRVTRLRPGRLGWQWTRDGEQIAISGDRGIGSFALGADADVQSFTVYRVTGISGAVAV